MKIFFSFLLCAFVAVPFMYFVAAIDPINPVSVRSYIVCLLSVVCTAAYFSHIVRESQTEQMNHMRNDGLSEDQIKSILGDKKYTSFTKK